MKKAIVTLKIKYDEIENDPPSIWDWNTLLDLSLGESVEVLNSEEL